MTNVQFTPELSELDFPTHDQPELALAKLRAEIDGRLRWLEENLLPDYKVNPGRSIGRALVEKSIIDAKTFEAIKEVMEAANPAAHGRKVDPSLAGIVIVTGLELVEMLDTLVVAAKKKVKNLSYEAQLIFRYLELPTRNRWVIAKEYGVGDPLEVSQARIQNARNVFSIARKEGKLPHLWNMVADQGGDLSKSDNPF